MTKKTKKTKGLASVKKDYIKKRTKNFSLAKLIFSAGLYLTFFLAIFLLYSYFTLPKLDNLYQINRTPKITLLAYDDTILTNYGDLYYKYVKYQEIPKHLINAVIATEDRRFFHHQGVDIIGIVRAIFYNVTKNRIAQGASTITQQLAKNLFLDASRTYKRKIQEIILAFYIEKKLVKEEIITSYLNRVYLGSGVYGVSGAAKYYFNKELKEITVAEAAIIAGLLKAPSRYNPNFSLENATKRGKIVLSNMVEAGYITQQQYKQYIQNIKTIKSPLIATLKKSYFSDWIIDQTRELFINHDQDLIIKTTLNPNFQQIAQHSLNEYIKKNGQSYNVHQAALVTLNEQGEILAMVGGKDYQIGGFNRAVYARRQPGSLFKIFTYITAFENGYFPDDVILDEPINLNGWSPQNNTKKYYGYVTLKEAFARSLNVASVRLAEVVGRNKIIKMAKNLGIDSEIKTHPSFSLGSFETNLLEITSSFASVMANGYKVLPFGIREIRQADGKILFKKKYPPPQKVLNDHTVLFTKELLREVIEEGSGKQAKINRVAYAKTGTSQKKRDGWFIGFDDKYIVGIWMGNDDNSPTSKLYGGNLPAEVWAEYLSRIH